MKRGKEEKEADGVIGERRCIVYVKSSLDKLQGKSTWPVWNMWKYKWRR